MQKLWKTDSKQKEQKMQDEFSVFAPKQEKELKDTFVVMMNMQIIPKTQNPLFVLP